MRKWTFEFGCLWTPTNRHVMRFAGAFALQREQRPVGGLPAVSQRVQWLANLDLGVDLNG